MATKHVIIVTGSRLWTAVDAIASVLNDACPDLVIEGGARGADAIARAWCQENGVECKTFRANWEALGKRAGRERNTRMLLAYPMANVRAFPLDGPGTADCMRQARALGMHVHAYDTEGKLL
jgi:SLOG family YspA-like protein